MERVNARVNSRNQNRAAILGDRDLLEAGCVKQPFQTFDRGSDQVVVKLAEMALQFGSEFVEVLRPDQIDEITVLVRSPECLFGAHETVVDFFEKAHEPASFDVAGDKL